MSFVKLTNKWSGPRSDTRTQIGTDYEYMYDGGMGNLGYILTEEAGDDMLPLYSKWSSSREDTRTQTSKYFSPEYDGDMGFLGYIFRTQKFGTVGLYQSYNSARNDTRVQTGTDHGEGYENVTLLGYVYTGKVYLSDVKFPNAVTVVKQRPKHVHSVLFENRTSQPQSQTFAFKDSQTNSHTFTVSDSESIGLKISVESKEGLSDVEEMKESMTVSFSATEKRESSRKSAETITKAYSMPIQGPPNKKVKATAVLWVMKSELDYEATIRIEGTSATKVITGKYYGVHSSEVVVDLEEVPLGS